ncbi:MAG: YihY/virulence factor BrkB family protein [Rhodomicrobiaceae bacterium]
MADDKAANSSRRGIAKWLFAIGSIFVAGYLTGHGVQKPRGRVARFADGLVRRLLFQSKKESSETVELSANELVRHVMSAVYSRFMEHNIMSVAAASAFFIVLAIFPSLAGLVALYGLLGDPADIAAFVASMPNIFPPSMVELIQNFLNQLISRSYANLTTLIVAFGIALWSANSAMKSLVESLNIVYERREKRSIVQLNILATFMTLTFLGFMIIAVNVMILPVWDWLVRTSGEALLRLRWVLLLFAVQVLISLLYYFAPCGRQKSWHLLTAGASIAALSWVVMSMGFSVYLTNFANYSVTYGSLGAAAIFMTWLWLTVTILLTGAEIDAAIVDIGARDDGESDSRR